MGTPFLVLPLFQAPQADRRGDLCPQKALGSLKAEELLWDHKEGPLWALWPFSMGHWCSFMGFRFEFFFFINEGGYLGEAVVMGKELPMSGKGRAYLEGNGIFKEDEDSKHFNKAGLAAGYLSLFFDLFFLRQAAINDYPQITQGKKEKRKQHNQQINELNNNK